MSSWISFCAQGHVSLVPWFPAMFKGPFSGYMLLSYKNTTGQRLLLELLRSGSTKFASPWFIFSSEIRSLHLKKTWTWNTSCTISSLPLIKYTNNTFLKNSLIFCHCGVPHSLWSCLAGIFSYNVIQRSPRLSFRPLDVKFKSSHRAWYEMFLVPSDLFVFPIMHVVEDKCRPCKFKFLSRLQQVSVITEPDFYHCRGSMLILNCSILLYSRLPIWSDYTLQKKG